MVKNPPANAGDARDVDSISESGRSSGEGNGNPLQYPCLGNPIDRGAWRVTLHTVAKPQTRLSTRACAHPHTHPHTHTHQSPILNIAKERKMGKAEREQSLGFSAPRCLCG